VEDASLTSGVAGSKVRRYGAGWASRRADFLRSMVEQQRFISKRLLAEKRIIQYRNTSMQRSKNREAVVLHRIKMAHVAEKEALAREVRQGEFREAAEEARQKLEEAEQLRARAIFLQKQRDLQRAEVKEMDHKIRLRERRRRILHEQAVLRKSLDKRKEAQDSRNAEVREQAARHRRRVKKNQVEHQATANFLSQQNMITKQLHSGMVMKMRQAKLQEVRRVVGFRRSTQEEHRNQVRQILFDNFNSKRAGAVSQQVSLRNSLNLRRLQEGNRVSMLRAHREHMRTVRAAAQDGALRIANASGSSSRPGTAMIANTLREGDLRSLKFDPLTARTTTGGGGGEGVGGRGRGGGRGGGGYGGFDFDEDENLTMQISALQNLAVQVKSQFNQIKKEEGASRLPPLDTLD